MRARKCVGREHTWNDIELEGNLDQRDDHLLCNTRGKRRPRVVHGIPSSDALKVAQDGQNNFYGHKYEEEGDRCQDVIWRATGLDNLCNG